MIGRKYLGKLLFIVIIVLSVKTVTSQVLINEGIVNGTWSKENSPYLIQGNIVIPSDSLLIIDPGVVVEFQGEYNLIVHGTISLNGEEGDSIKFTALDTTSGWRGLRIIGPSSDTISIQYSIFEFVVASANYPDAYYGAICIDSNAVLKILNSRITNNINCTSFFSMIIIF